MRSSGSHLILPTYKILIKHKHRQPCPPPPQLSETGHQCKDTHDTLHVLKHTHIFVALTITGMIHLLAWLSCLTPSLSHRSPVASWSSEVCTHRHRHRQTQALILLALHIHKSPGCTGTDTLPS